LVTFPRSAPSRSIVPPMTLEPTALVTGTDSPYGEQGSASFDLIVNNVAADLQNVAVTNASENGMVTLAGEIVDPGLQDTFTLNINWGDPLSPDNVEQYTFPSSASGSGTAVQSFSITHQYLDDNPNGAPSDVYDITLSLADDDALGLSVNFYEDDQVTGSTGLFPAGNWNNFSGAGGSANDLTNSTGGSTTADIAWSSNNTGRHGSWPADGGIGSLFRDYLDTGNGGFGNGVDIDFSQLPAPFSSGFDVLVYFDGDGTNRFGNYEVSAGGDIETQVGNDPANNINGDFVVDNGLDDSGNTLIFVGFSGTTAQIRSGATSGFRAPINGVQLIESHDTQTVTTTITNVAPAVSLGGLAAITENDTLTLTGSFADIGRLDAHTVAIDWDDPNDAADATFNVTAIWTVNTTNGAISQTLSTGNTFNSTTDDSVLTVTGVNVATGEVTFSVTHQYLDDGPAGGRH